MGRKMQDTTTTNNSQEINFEEYKQQVRDFLIGRYHYTIEGASKSMKLYEDDILSYYQEGYGANVAGFSIVFGA